MYSIFVVLCLVDTAFAGSAASGHCPHVEVVPNFNISKVNLISSSTSPHWEKYNIIIPRIYEF